MSFLKVNIKGNTKGNTNKCTNAYGVLFYCIKGGNMSQIWRCFDWILTVLPSFFMPKYRQREGCWCFQMKYLKKFLQEKNCSL